MASTAEILLAPFPGETLSVPYIGYEPVSLLIERVKNLLGDKYYIEYEALYFNGIGIRDTSRTIDDCKVYGNVISIRFHHHPAPPVGRPTPIPGEKPFKILIDHEGVRVYRMNVSESNTGEDISWKIYQKVGIGYYKQRLIFKGQRITNQRLVDYGIQDGDMLHMLVEMRGVGFSDDAPDGRVVCKGMNIEADCKCTPDYHVICMRRYGLYELNKDVLYCPVCYSRDVVPVTVGFHKCEYRTHGIRSDGTQFSTDWITIDNDNYNVYDSEDKSEWARLVIQTRPLEQDYDKELCVICDLIT
ncbi:hypothetical protein LRAMOSA04662 [Lichtheimia ramosa]|uniref:Ubiquitin-like domain-containing protein n=1 Tax=Lichtheimia ramosa TaxID=688394 RepID=A0A077WZT0_9FUNG|nr:hypothetical protein LRAMOSA04662 [Lichtheimia ramosa]